ENRVQGVDSSAASSGPPDSTPRDGGVAPLPAVDGDTVPVVRDATVSAESGTVLPAPTPVGMAETGASSAIATPASGSAPAPAPITNADQFEVTRAQQMPGTKRFFVDMSPLDHIGPVTIKGSFDAKSVPSPNGDWTFFEPQEIAPDVWMTEVPLQEKKTE